MSEEEKTSRPSGTHPVWMTLVVGLLMFVVGAAAGYFGRPLISREQANETQPPAVPEQTSVPGAAETQAAGAEDLMDFLVEETRHFIGDEDAPVTIIEFSDFQ